MEINIRIDDSITDRDSIHAILDKYTKYVILDKYAKDRGTSIIKVGDGNTEAISKMTQDCRKYRSKIRELGQRDSHLMGRLSKLTQENEEMQRELNFRIKNDSRSTWLDL